MSKRELLKRYFFLVVGLFIMSLGVAISTKANLGISPVSCVPYVLSLGLPWTMGQITIVMHIIFILLQIVLLRKDFKLIQLLQLAIAVLFGFFTDFSLWLISFSGLAPHQYITQWCLCLFSFVIIAFGVNLEVKANVVMLAGEGLMLAISKVFHKEFGKVKIGFDCVQVVLGVSISFAFFGHLKGIREGTIAAAILVGMIVRFYSRKLTLLNKMLELEENDDESSAANHDQDSEEEQPIYVITIDGEYGSGGYNIGQVIAERLGIDFYDKDIIELEAKESGLTTEYIQENEQKLTNSLLYDLYMQSYAYVNEEKPKFDELFLTQSKVIRELSNRKSCVIVERLGNYILKQHKNCFHVFIHADKEYRINRVMCERGYSESEAEKECKRKNTERRNHCKYYTNETWGMAKDYHLTINSALYEDEEVVDLIIGAFQKYQANHRISLNS
ncbi:cytidylate kinase family protein [Anaeromicropila herbilytica]|uniref:Cytidylate kinase family protein n=1 Tax=Anaeromicropila herbilytica TaxID=2785025 RepID=A0A7R7IEE8_9FIRM|nr:cytidylate kinase family protein [Anaeromicropila herbilytica]BCN32572.1 hypothetical protein bsdtb5_38670 [Anaeromicropila herbilytica]